MKFDEMTISKLFGAEAAEDEDEERLQQYYFKNDVYDQVVNDLPLRIIVGHKGIGKSALFKVAINEENEKNRLTLLIKPDDIDGIGENDKEFLKLIKEWKKGLLDIIIQKVLSSFGSCLDQNTDDWRIKLNNFGGKVIDFLTNTIQQDKVNLTPSKQLILENFLKHGKISIYIDDLDRGWQGRRQDIHRISALLNAVRDLASDNKGLFFRISLRSDVYYLARTSDESTDKIESSVIWYKWDNHQILALLVKRIESYFGRNIPESVLIKKTQSNLMNYLKPIIEEKFTGKGHWADTPMYRVLMSLIRKRPRDLVKILTLSAREAHRSGSEIIKTNHLESIFEEYSQSRLQDTINEYRSELPDIERLILGMRPSARARRASTNFLFSSQELQQKIRSIEEQGKFKWANGKQATISELAGFLYKINFITARKQTENGIDRKYFEENRYLSNNFRDFGYDWEVHPAYRWALQPEDPFEVFQSLD